MPRTQRVPEYIEPIESSWSVKKNLVTATLISEETYRTYGQTLLEYSENSIDENRWVIPFTDGIRRATVSFESLHVAEEELRLVKIYIVDTLALYASPSTCASKVRNLAFLFLFLQEKEFRVTMLSTSIINLFRIWLDEFEYLSATRKNAIESDLRGFVSFLREQGLLREGHIVIPRPRPTPPGSVRRAPDQCTMRQIDTYFFDFSNDIPTTYRCLYLLLRLIPGRNPEAFSMRMDGFGIEEDLFWIKLPTYKETANHRAVEIEHYRYAEKYPENLLLRSLQEQKEYAKRCQKQLEDPEHKGRLMVSPRNPKRLVTSDEFNAFLEEVCEEQRVTDAYGNPAKITIYSLRHASGAMMAASTEVDRSEFTRAFAHNSRYSDDSYSYASEHDQLYEVAPYTAAVRGALTAVATEGSAAQIVSPMRLKRMQRDPQTQLIGTGSVCQEKGCTPQFEHCVFCNSFYPDTQYLTEAEECCELLRQRIEQCRDVGDEAALQANEKQLAVYEAFIQRVGTQ